ncbi:MAG TPA: TerB family tellurite resistance protein [Gammaproteobacteria bacterium]|jgi:uncharacterized tellurite resistance protein B-like protein|nr:TerB family tellurite resistance protein [Gammaproteobacteria bacterium]
MLKALNDLFDRAFGAEQPTDADRDRALRVATALLLIEVARADYQADGAEDRAIYAEIKKFFQLDDEATQLLVQEAAREADRAVSLQSFTRRLVEELSEGERHRVVEMLWRVALADRRLDKREDYVVRQVADLLYVSQSDLIRIRNRIYEPQL